ncbi:hypothetical protein PHYPO_G00087140 [Pangasianodon hypophthalmus]|uniref:Uncharacterized protein n=1 Tax=Pangasianodon hypophthalmus TaxID=310915 RepID=A0A5N5LH99_PANHP|nr:hypothetical protein PHYPO_G00087140 [Pangasianodon hypophthalmus]
MDTDDNQRLKRYLETSHCQIVQQMEDTGQPDVSPCLFPLTASAAAQKAVTEDAFLDALQKQQMKLEDSNCLLAELARIEQDLRERLHIQEERRRELERVRQEENRLRWRNLCFLILNQRTTK